MTTAFDDAETAIITLWQSLWTLTPTAYENVTFDPNALSATDLAAGFVNGEAWTELKITELPGLGQMSTAGDAGGTNRLWRVPGLVGAIINVPVGRGKQQLRQLLDAASDIFRAYSANTTVGHLLFFNPTVTAAGPNAKDQAWFQASMIIRFWYDYTA